MPIAVQIRTSLEFTKIGLEITNVKGCESLTLLQNCFFAKPCASLTSTTDRHFQRCVKNSLDFAFGLSKLEVAGHTSFSAFDTERSTSPLWLV